MLLDLTLIMQKLNKSNNKGVVGAYKEVQVSLLHQEVMGSNENVLLILGNMSINQSTCL